jgi:single-strand DNA-binding protein
MAKGTLNKVMIIGRLGADPEMRFSGDGAAIATFNLATNEAWKNREGEAQEKTNWHRCVVFGALAEKVVQPYLKKGNLVYIEGRLQTRSWEDKDGNTRYITEVVCNSLEMLGSSGGDSSAGEPMNQEPAVSEEDTSQVPEDDLPF